MQLRFLSFGFFFCLNSLSAQTESLKFNSKTVWPILGLSGASVAGLILFEKDLAPKHCRWCSTNSLDTRIRNELKWSDDGLANKLSHISGFVIEPLFAVGSHFWLDYQSGTLSKRYHDYAVIGESAIFATLLGQIVKLSVGRERPNSHFSNPRVQSSSHNTSFYSGHSSFAFSLAVSSGMVASLESKKFAPLIWTGGLAVATATAYLRVAADRHYFTDVLAGAIAGSVVGFSVPYFFHPLEKSGSKTSMLRFFVVPSPEGLMASTEWTW